MQNKSETQTWEATHIKRYLKSSEGETLQDVLWAKGREGGIPVALHTLLERQRELHIEVKYWGQGVLGNAGSSKESQ